MRRWLGRLAAPLLKALPAEAAHRLAVRALALRGRGEPPEADPRLAVEAFGVKFPNPLGLAAGFDKNGECVDGALSLSESSAIVASRARSCPRAAVRYSGRGASPTRTSR